MWDTNLDFENHCSCNSDTLAPPVWERSTPTFTPVRNWYLTMSSDVPVRTAGQFWSMFLTRYVIKTLELLELIYAWTSPPALKLILNYSSGWLAQNRSKLHSLPQEIMETIPKIWSICATLLSEQWEQIRDDSPHVVLLLRISVYSVRMDPGA
jgi:hypothetical protein